jgi:hypothetical protein
MPIHLGSPSTVAAAADSSVPTPIPEEEEFYSSWSLFLVCLLLILSLWTSYYLQIKRIRAIHETVVSIVAGMVVGFIVRLAPGHLIREMLVSHTSPRMSITSTLRCCRRGVFPISFEDDTRFFFVFGDLVAILK